MVEGGFEFRTRLNRQVIERLQARSPSDPESLWRLASLHRQVGDLSAAREVLERIPEPERSAAARRLLRILRRESLPPADEGTGFQPSPFVVYDDFLDATRCAELSRCVRERRTDFAPGKVYTPDHQHAPVVAEEARRSLVLSSPAEIAEWLLPRVRQRVEDSLATLGLRPFGLFDTEIHVSASGHGDRLQCHQDVRPHPAPQRRVSYVLYFGVGERRFEGGDFILYDTDVAQDRWDAANYTRIEPLHNRLLLFGGHTYHEVAEVRCDPASWESRRFAVCGWFREP
jgi:hypothetical protein